MYTSQCRYYVERNQNPRFHKPRLSQIDASPHTSKWFLETRPPNTFQTIGISMDLTIACREADTPVGGRLFSENWTQISRDSGNDCQLQTGLLQCPPAQAYSSGSHEWADIPALDKELKQLTAKPAIERVLDPAEAYLISPMF